MYIDLSYCAFLCKLNNPSVFNGPILLFRTSTRTRSPTAVIHILPKRRSMFAEQITMHYLFICPHSLWFCSLFCMQIWPIYIYTSLTIAAFAMDKSSWPMIDVISSSNSKTVFEQFANGLTDAWLLDTFEYEWAAT